MQYLPMEQRYKNYVDEKYGIYDNANEKFYDSMQYYDQQHYKKLIGKHESAREKEMHRKVDE